MRQTASAMREEKITADRLTAFSDAVFAVIVTVMVLELKAPDHPAFSALWPLWPGHQLCGELPVHRHYLDQPPSPYAVRRSSDAGIDMDQLRPSLHGLAPALCHRMDCAHQARVVPCSALRRSVCMRRHCLQRLRTPSIGPADATQVSARIRRMGRRRSLVVLAGFTTAMPVALVAPRLGFALICGALILHLRPDVSGGRS